MDTRPYYVRTRPSSQDPQSFATDRIDFSKHHLPAYPKADGSGALPDSRPLANSLFDSRAAAVVSAAIVDPTHVTVYPQRGDSDFNALLERKKYGDAAPTILILTAKCLAAMAYKDYFPDSPQGNQLRQLVSDAIMAASPGWCGTFGPDVDAYGHSTYEGNYDMTQMWLLPLAYAYYDLLSPAAREKLITELLASGRIHRAALDDTFTSGGAPNDWDRAGRIALLGFATVSNVSETENHVLMIATARYLTNQLLYPRALGKTIPVLGPVWPLYDNRRNGNPDDSRPTCMDQVLLLLRNKLLDDFAEYNAKPYQEETRNALLNLFSYAYDAEVRVAAGMVLDYVSAHVAVSSCDLRRMVPFRRRDEDPYQRQDSTDPGFIDVSLLDARDASVEAHGADPMSGHFAIHAGNMRAYQLPDIRVWPGDSAPARPWFSGIANTGAPQLFLEAVCDHRLAPSVHDLFVNDLHRRYYQRLHRHGIVEPGNQHNCDNMEIYSGSPSYLITAGGRPAPWVILGGFKPTLPAGVEPVGWQQQNLGVALPISFMPVSFSVGAGVSTSDSRHLIQILQFSDVPPGFAPITGTDHGGTENYGVAPDFACGLFSHFPKSWIDPQASGDGVHFIDMHAAPLELTLRTLFGFLGIPVENGVRILAKQVDELQAPISLRALIAAVTGFGGAEPAGFYLAIHKQGGFCILEAFDTWRHPEVSFEAFQGRVKSNNPDVLFASGQESVYTTYFGNRIHYVIWQNLELDNHKLGSKILQIEYGGGDPSDTLVDAGNDTNPFLSGTILRSQGDGKVEIHNPSLNTTLTLDWSDPQHLVRISENGDRQQAGAGYEVWVDFNWTQPSAGDFYQPFNTLEGGLNAVAEGGVIRIMTGSHRERLTIHKRVTLKAAGGTVTLSAH
jgi:hypothetical protein